MDSEPVTAKVRDIVQIMDRWAPSWTAESWDRVGLLAGDPDWPVERALVALELTSELLDAAIDGGFGMILTHHPPLFSPLTNLRTDNPANGRLLRAVANKVALFAAHTNLDAAPEGVNDALAAALGLEDTRPLARAGESQMLKLTTFIPADALHSVSRALHQAGAGEIGRYTDCSFAAAGTGRFTAPPDADPQRGGAGLANAESELRLEVLLPKSASGRVVAALYRAHPYEEPAYDIYPVQQGPSHFGMGRVGRLTAPLPGEEFLARAAEVLGAPSAQVCGPLPELVDTVAVVGGSGGDLLGAAAAAGAQVLITGEARYHSADQAADMGLCLCCMGHFQTENVVVKPWAGRLATALESAGYNCFVEAYAKGRDPWRPVR